MAYIAALLWSTFLIGGFSLFCIAMAFYLWGHRDA
jgi:hypothetical protein